MLQTMSLQKKKQMVNFASFALIAILFAVIFNIRSVSAWDFDLVTNKTQVAQIKTITEGVYPIITDTLGLSSENATGLNKGYNDFYTLMTGDESPISAVSKTFMGIGGAFAVVTAFMHFMQHMERGMEPVEAVFKILIELVLVFLIIVNSDTFLGLMRSCGEVVVDGAATVFTNPEAQTVSPEDILKELTGKDKGTLMWQILASMSLMIPYALAVLAKIAAKFVVLQLLFELGIRQVLTPIFIADIYEEGLRSPGARHLKLYFAVYLKMAICILVCALSAMLVGNTGSTGAAMLIEIVAINWTSIGVMFKAGEYVNAFV